MTPHTFTVQVDLSPFSFDGSYQLQLFLEKVFVGETSVFSRLEPSTCVACTERRHAGTRLRGAIYIPRNLYSNVPADTLVDYMLQNLSALVEFLRSKGVNTATLAGNRDSGQRGVGDLPDFLQPRLSLCSYAIADSTRPGQGVEYRDRRIHGSISFNGSASSISLSSQNNQLYLNNVLGAVG